jgi:DNA repair photolyase
MAKDVEKEIREEALAFLRQNKGTKLDMDNPQALRYISPRISSEFMDCSMPMTFDNYSHCSLGCQYCFAYMFKSNNVSFSNKLHAVDPKKIHRMVRREPKTAREKSFFKHFFSKRFLLHWGGLADPFCNFEKSNDNSYQIIKVLAQEQYPTLFSFKGSTMWRPKFQKLFGKYADNKSFAFQVSIIAPSDEMSKKIEIGVPVTSRRIDAIRNLSEMGYYTILRLRPFIIGITDDGLDELLHRSLEAGIQAVSMEFVALDIRSNEGLMKRYRWMGDMIGTKDILQYFKTLSPKERGGYMRLNRLVKEPYVKQVYQFCVENDILFACSDPDYKELNMSGSCCGMPDIYKPNKEMSNWTKNQLTWHMKEARRLLHSEGRTVRLKFDTVFKPKEDSYLLSKNLGQDHICVSDKTAAERHSANYLKFARDIWNNLRAPGNPRNYFHGKLMPIAKDEQGNLVYVYKPSEYEERWIAEGIDLKTK